MDSITIEFAEAINVSLQIGDTAFFKDSSDQIFLMGAVTSITQFPDAITCEIPSSTPRPSTSDFIFFVKDEEINKTGLLGHYGEITLTCTPGVGENPEIYAISSEAVTSS